TTLVERVFTARGAALAREKYKGREIIRSSDERRGAAVIIGDFLALGGRERLMQLIDSSQSGRSFNNSPQGAVANKIAQPAAVKSFTSVREESGEMLAAIARWMASESEAPTSNVAALNLLPFASSATSINNHGVYVESHSPFGNLPFLVSIIAGAADAK